MGEYKRKEAPSKRREVFITFVATFQVFNTDGVMKFGQTNIYCEEGTIVGPFLMRAAHVLQIQPNREDPGTGWYAHLYPLISTDDWYENIHGLALDTDGVVRYLNKRHPLVRVHLPSAFAEDPTPTSWHAENGKLLNPENLDFVYDISGEVNVGQKVQLTILGSSCYNKTSIKRGLIKLALMRSESLWRWREEGDTTDLHILQALANLMNDEEKTRLSGRWHFPTTTDGAAEHRIRQVNRSLFDFMGLSQGPVEVGISVAGIVLNFLNGSYMVHGTRIWPPKRKLIPVDEEGDAVEIRNIEQAHTDPALLGRVIAIGHKRLKVHPVLLENSSENDIMAAERSLKALKRKGGFEDVIPQKRKK